MIKVTNKGKTDDYVYDISLDGTVVNALGLNVLSNTDGFNFQLPKKYRYTKEQPYIGKGLSREVKEGKEYTGYEADVAEFNDMYMRDFHYSENSVNKMGLGIDECLECSANISRKNYLDFFPEKPYPEDVKIVGNTLKSKKLPTYIATFLDKAIRLLLREKGGEFIDEYYAYIEKIYNYQIPLRDIASKGKIKKSLEEYRADCNTITKAGRPKSRQAWMELAINANLNVNMGETIYYINTGKSISQPDVKKVTHYYQYSDNVSFEGEKKDIKSLIDKEYKKLGDKTISKEDFIAKYYPNIKIEEEIILNSHLLPSEIIESDEDILCTESMLYNVPKYIDQFNKRITPLLVCFSKEIRDKIIITKPSDRKYFTDEEVVLTSGEPNKPGDQDTYEQLMTMDDKEIRFWAKYPEFKIPFLEECGMNWDVIYKDYLERMEREKQLGIDLIREEYDKILDKMTISDIDDFEDGKMPSALSNIVDIDPTSNHLVCKKYPDVIIGTIFDILELREVKENQMEDLPSDEFVFG